MGHLPPPLDPPLDPPLIPPLDMFLSTDLTGTTTLLVLIFSWTSFSEISPFFIFFCDFLIVLESLLSIYSPNSLERWLRFP